MTYASVYYWVGTQWAKVAEGWNLDPAIIYAAPPGSYPVFVWWWTGSSWQEEIVWDPASGS